MSKIARIRILNLNYNNNTIKIDDETFDLGGQNTLISLRNGGGKSVLVQMIVSLFVNRTYRDFGDRSFKSYFTTNRPTFLMTEWQLDNNSDRFLAGMMVRKNQKEDNDIEELEIYTFTGSYSEACKYDLDNLPIIRQDGNKKILRGFSECKNLLEDISKKEAGDFRLYDMTSQYGRQQYFTTLRQYQINNKEWESIIRKVNQKESGLSELFQNAKDEKGLVEKWFLRPIEEKLNQEENKIDKFRKLSFQFIEQYRSNQSKIQRKGRIEQYFEDTKPLKLDIDRYVQMNQDSENLRKEMILYAKTLQNEVKRLEDEIRIGQEKLEQIRREQNQIIYEQLSYLIYEQEDKKTELLTKRKDQELEVIRLFGTKGSLQKKLTICDLNRLYLELKNFEHRKAEVDEKIKTLMQKNDASREKIEAIGHQLYILYTEKVNELSIIRSEHENKYEEIVSEEQSDLEEQTKTEHQIRSLIGKIGGLKTKVDSFDEIEESFNKEFRAELSRNILGFYEQGFLDIRKKDMSAELQEQKNKLSRFAQKQIRMEQSLKRLGQETSESHVKIHEIMYQIKETKDVLVDLEQQKNARLRIMKYVGVDGKNIDKVGLLLDQLDGKIRELDMDRSRLLQKISGQEKQFRQLKEGKITELPENIRSYMEQNGIDIIYGMEWIGKNGRTPQENEALIRKNPFLPYSILMERNIFERFYKNEEELYTSFPIPIIVKEDLETIQENTDRKFATYGNVHFYVMFNKHLLDREELKRMLEEIQENINKLRKTAGEKEQDLNIYRGYKTSIEQQTFSSQEYRKTEENLAEQEKEKQQIEKRLTEIRQEQTHLEEEKKQTEKLLETVKQTISWMESRAHQFEKICRKYEEYESDKVSLARLEKEQKELTKKQSKLSILLNDLREQKTVQKDQIREYQEQIKKFRSRTAEYDVYKANSPSDDFKYILETDASSLEIQYRALTEEISKNIQELKNEQKWLQEVIEKKKDDLERRNDGEQIPEEEYKNLVYSEEQYNSWKTQLKQAVKDYNHANQTQAELEKEIGSCTTSIQFYTENLKRQTGFEQPVARTAIVDTEFEKRQNFKKYDFQVQQKALDQLKERNVKLSAQAVSVAEFADEAISKEEEAALSEKMVLVDVRNGEPDVIQNYQKDMRRRMSELSKMLGNCRMSLADLIRAIASGKEYADDYFRKTFDSLLSQIDQPENLLRQFDMNSLAYENQLEKLKIDLAHIDDEQKNLEMMFLEYVEQINANISMIDKNSTITVRNRNLKMLRIQVPEWESEKEHFRLKLHDYFENVINRGIVTIEKNENLTEYLGKMITVRNLYDEIVGIQNVKIKLYKIEAEREVPISWSEVSANSGGEGFLSAFVILTCLLSYMRRDETSFFTSGEEGKVLIMDNPFAQTNAEHLLKPLIEMAKKTNTQLICLSGLGGDSIYNRFDNIYVVKLLESSIRNGVQRVETSHVKGEEVKRLVLSDFRMEQVNLFDIWEV